MLLAPRITGFNSGCRGGEGVSEWMQVPVTFTRRGSVCITLKEVVGQGESTVTVHKRWPEKKNVPQHKTLSTTTEIFVDEGLGGQRGMVNANN